MTGPGRIIPLRSFSPNLPLNTQWEMPHGMLTPPLPSKRARYLADATRGEDPVETRKAARKAPCVANFAADYLDRHAVPKKRAKSVRDDRSMLDNIVLPKLGEKKSDRSAVAKLKPFTSR